MALKSVTSEHLPAADQPAEAETIRLRGCRVHNLKNIDLDIPRNQFVVLTGPSGSGKSSLAFDTLFAEGQRQYIESLSVYTRQFLDQMERPDVDLIEGLQPTIAIDQRPGAQNPRSTVATVTEIYDYLRLLWARAGEAHCYQCGALISQQTPEQILDHLLQLPSGTKAILMAPMVRGRKGRHEDVFDAIRKAGFVRVRVDGEVYTLDEVPPLEVRKNHTIEAVVDRVILRQQADARLSESLRLALKHGDELLTVIYLDGASGQWHETIFSTQYACPHCKISYEELQPRTFSFNSPYGACAECDGLGLLEAFDPELVLPDAALSLAQQAVAPWRVRGKAADKKLLPRHQRALAALAKAGGFSLDEPLEQLKPKARKVLLEGQAKTPGLLALLQTEYELSDDEAQRAQLAQFRSQLTCGACGGARLRAEARSVLVGSLPIHQLTAYNVAEALAFFRQLSVPEMLEPVARPILREVIARLEFLSKVGLPYLTLDRAADTLSGGELQRVRLATGIGSALVGCCYVLDEPTTGLHPRDNERLIEALHKLQELGNTLLVVEHDESVMRASNYLIDIGPGAGVHGGQIVAQGTPDEVARMPQSITGQYLSGTQQVPLPVERRRTSRARSLAIEGATVNNLKNVSATFPLSALVCITGVSGSGKSSLLNETLAKALVRRLTGFGPRPGAFASLRGVSQIDKLIEVDQSPIGRTPRSNPATYTGVFDEVRKVFAQTKEARLRGYKLGRFSFNVAGGRCEECQGQGQRKIEMNFLPDLYVTCPVCQGQRFNRQTLEVRYRERSIADVLEMRIDEAREFFDNFPAISRLLDALQRVGLGYLTLGQSCTTLSGGEAQRIKLATELARVSTGKTLYLLDEPTVGLHFDDVRRLLDVLHQLVELGNTVIVIEHNLDVMKSADWIIDMGPEGGSGGGEIVAVGTPEEIAACEASVTGRYLRPLLSR